MKIKLLRKIRKHYYIVWIQSALSWVAYPIVINKNKVIERIRLRSLVNAVIMDVF